MTSRPMPRRRRGATALLAVILVATCSLGSGRADGAGGSGGGVTGPTLPTNDLEAMLALTGAQLARELTPVELTKPALRAVPRAHCGPGSRPLAGEQGRVTQADVRSAAAKRGWTCNTRVVSHVATPGGWRVWRYTDPHGHTCAYYDTSFTAPANILSVAGGPSLGVQVLDMDDPAHPRSTATLVSPAMISPHESLNLNSRRGLLAAEVGNALTLPGTMDVYDVRSDCRHPRLLSTTPIATGHESGFSPDGRTFWVAGGAGYIYAFDLTDPRHPKELWRGAYYSHGLSLSGNGRVLFQTDPINGNVGLLDVSQIQERRAHPHVHDLSRVTWPTASIPQNTEAFTSHGHHYLLEFEEFAFRFNPATIADRVGAARILDVDDLHHPRLVSNVRLSVNMRAHHVRDDGDPSALPPAQIFANTFHYCALSSRRNPVLLACSAMTSGLRVFDIRHPAHPREVAYYVAPPKAARPAGLLAGDLATSQPAFDHADHEVWYSDAGDGFYALKLPARLWRR